MFRRQAGLACIRPDRAGDLRESGVSRMQPSAQTWRDINFSARDGLRLYARHYPAPGSTRRPVLCLAGLSRNSRDFHRLATALASPGDAGRDVYALDSRGRGLSEHDRDWRNYSLLVELNDALDFIDHERAARRRRHRHLARRAARHADGGAAAQRHRRRRPQRHRPGDRARRARAHRSPTSAACPCPPTGRRPRASSTR